VQELHVEMCGITVILTEF